jgi:GTP-binding protein HflX
MRAEIPVPSLALVGYTNAGKSTLFRALTGAEAYVADQLFATLDPTVRRIQLPGGTAVVVADTVGFIRELPHELVAAFQSTLTEARAATLLLHVVDASNPRRDEHVEAVNRVLEEIGASAIPQILIYNKIDRLESAPRIDRDADGRATAVWISAERAVGLDLLRDAVAERLALFARRALLKVPASAGALRSRLYAARAVRGETSGTDGSIELAVELPDPDLLELARTAGVQILEVQETGTPCAPGTPYLQSNAISRVGKLR